ncbi:helix-turn-helix domain-containing protein [Embleya sp. NPDC056575]|uniref:helix-turn-helix domain-containing protein n=1 Tax=unclassified Embleya TaxID=2699296 RepID=UPI003682542F
MVTEPSRAEATSGSSADRSALRARTVCLLDGDALPDLGGAANADARADTIVVVIPISGSIAVSTDDRDDVLSTGALLVVDGRRPSTFASAGASELALVAFARGLLTEPDPAIGRAAGRVLDAERGTAALVSSALVSLCRTSGSDVPLDRMSHHVADLVSTLIAELAENPRPARADELMADIRWYVNCHLGDPGLSPESIAAAHYVSVRYLHKLFEGEGVTLARWIQRRRLHECRRELGRTGRNTVKVATVAQRWGFANPAHFSRAFRTAFGVSPRDWRESRTTGHEAEAGSDR